MRTQDGWAAGGAGAPFRLTEVEVSPRPPSSRHFTVSMRRPDSSNQRFDPESGDRVRAALWGKLQTARLWPEWESFESGRALVLSWGEREAAQLISDVGRRAWVTGIEPVRSALRDSDVVRILGFGRLLTEYIIAPLRISALARPATVRLGSLANFIVTFYDLLLDQGVGAGEILPRKVLSARARGAGWLIAWQSLTGSAPARLVAQLVALYFACFEDIALRGSRSEQVGSLLRRFIIRMHEAELLTRVAGPMNHRTVRRKAALPFAVMGLPGWLSACPPMTPREHLSWCYRLGLYFGRSEERRVGTEFLSRSRTGQGKKSRSRAQ